MRGRETGRRGPRGGGEGRETGGGGGDGPVPPEHDTRREREGDNLRVGG